MITVIVMTAMGGQMELHMGLEIKVNRKGRGNERGSGNAVCTIRIVTAMKMIIKMGVSNKSNSNRSNISNSNKNSDNNNTAINKDSQQQLTQ